MTLDRVTADNQRNAEAIARIPTAPWIFAFSASAIVLALRAPDSLTMPQFWAEDGTIFFLGQHGHWLPQLFSAYAGYLLWIPRLVAWLASIFSAVYAPTIYNYATLAIAALGIASLRELRLGIRDFIFILAPFALTPTNGEVFGTLTNVQWFTHFYLLVVVLRFLRGEEPARAWHAGVATALVALSGPFCLFADVALAAGALWQRLIEGRWPQWRGPAARCIWVLLACSAVQLYTLANSSEIDHAPSAQLLDGLLATFQVMQAHVLGRDVVPDWLFLSLFAILVTASAIAIGSSEVQRTTYICVLVFVLSELLASVAKTGDSLRMYPTLAFGDRYFVAVKIFAWWCIAVVISAVWRRDIRVVRVVMVILLGINALFVRDALQRRPLEDMNWYPYARMIDDGDAVVVPINPRYWKIKIPQRSAPPSQ